MRVACAYTGRSRWALARAVRDGLLPAAGKNGRSLVFDREALDRWLVGADERASSLPPKQTRERPSSASTADALARLRVLTGAAR